MVTRAHECLAGLVSENAPFPVRVVRALENSPVSRLLDRLLTTVTAPVVPSDGSPWRHAGPRARDPSGDDRPAAGLLDVGLPDRRPRRQVGPFGSHELIAVGLLAAGPTAYAGLADWSRLEGADRRVGAVHAIGNDVAIVLFAGSFLARVRGQHWRGVRLAVLGNLATLGAGHLGGHLALSSRTASRP